MTAAAGAAPTEVKEVEGVRFCQLCGRFKPLREFEDRRTGRPHRRCRRHRLTRSNAERVKFRVHTARRRAREYGAEVNTLTVAEVQLMYGLAKNRCPTCRAKLRTKYDLEISHVVALCRGGDNSRGNVLLECGPCNRRRGWKATAPAEPSARASRARRKSGRAPRRLPQAGQTS